MSMRQPNIILLVLDTHRAERMSLYGYGKHTTPNIDRLAEKATVFDWAIAPGQWTIPSHSSMFTGLYPTVHQTTQSYDTLPPDIPTLAELLAGAGYHTVGFCNNPLVGVLDNGLKRGFVEFYNYGQTFPDVPRIGVKPGLRRFQRAANVVLQKISTPIERQFGRSPLLLKLASMPIFVPLWSRMLKFKGDTVQSLQDVTGYLKGYHRSRPEHPLFMFINMMETHFPYYPPPRVVDKWVPYFRRDREAREYVQRLNGNSYRWMAPVMDPLAAHQQHALSDMYDAEVAYQDQLLRRVFRHLRRSGRLDDTMVIVMSDHGENHGEHGFMGHGFSIYNEIARVPFFIHYPEMFPARRVSHPVSTRRIFHTILEAAGIGLPGEDGSASALSLTRSLGGPDGEPADEVIVTESYSPLNLLNVIEMNEPQALPRYRINQNRRAIFSRDWVKLMTVGDRTDEVFDVRRDPAEAVNLLDNPVGYENAIIALERQLEDFTAQAEKQRGGTSGGRKLDFSDNPELLERLRGLGYIE